MIRFYLQAHVAQWENIISKVVNYICQIKRYRVSEKYVVASYVFWYQLLFSIVKMLFDFFWSRVNKGRGIIECSCWYRHFSKTCVLFQKENNGSYKASWIHLEGLWTMGGYSFIGFLGTNDLSNLILGSSKSKI